MRKKGGLTDKVCKLEGLTIEDSGLPLLGEKELSSGGCFEADIVTIW